MEGGLDLDTMCRYGTQSGIESAEERSKKRALRGFCDGLVHQQNRNVIAYRICPEAGATLQTLAVGFECERLFADGTNQNIEQVLGNHGRILRHHQPRLKLVPPPSGRNPSGHGHSSKIGLEDPRHSSRSMRTVGSSRPLSCGRTPQTPLPVEKPIWERLTRT
jgi:hypothetical protein